MSAVPVTWTVPDSVSPPSGVIEVLTAPAGRAGCWRGGAVRAKGIKEPLSDTDQSGLDRLLVSTMIQMRIPIAPPDLGQRVDRLHDVPRSCAGLGGGAAAAGGWGAGGRGAGAGRAEAGCRTRKGSGAADRNNAVGFTMLLA